MRRLIALLAAVGGAGLAGQSCNDEAKAAVGAPCVLHTDCTSGLCAAQACIAQGTDDDGDGVTNADEVRAGSDPLVADTDGDGRLDGEEMGPDPDSPIDTDGDGKPDFLESSIKDRDLDGVPDELDPTDDVPDLDAGIPCIRHDDCGEGICVGGQCYGAEGDLDQDGLDNATERRLGTNPLNPDTDADGAKDGEEVGDDPSNPRDSDGDGVIDALESSIVDSDGDGTPDQFDPT